MRRITLITALVLMAAMPMFAERVTSETACKVASAFLNNNGKQALQLTDLSKEVGFSNLYIFSSNEGFVVMSADDCVQPILGYSLNGRFEFENMPDNKRAWLQGYNDNIQYVIDNKLSATSEVAQQWRDLAEGNMEQGRDVIVGPLLQTKWNQGSPYNLLCPSNSVTGCVATAMAQIMKYWDYPEHGIGSHSYIHATYGELSADFQSTVYDWNNMTNTYNSSSTETQQMAVATLMYHCGVAVNMNYSPSSSGAGSAIVADALKDYFNYSSEVVYHSRSDYEDDNTWIGMLKADLNQNRPIWYSGTGEGGGHAFVFDGYDSDNRFHVNWGWGGYCDEYYVVNSLNPGPGGIGSGSNGIYNDNQGAVFGIHPSECVANAPLNLAFTQNGRNITLSWSAASSAASYNVYCNGSYAGNTSSTTYNHVAPYGSNIYYVRSVDANGALSLSSNAVTVTVSYPVPLVDDLNAEVSGNNATLTWTAPDWCYPETPTATLTYGTQTISGTYFPFGSYSMYWGHKHLAENISSYNGMQLYSVDFYCKNTGNYQLCIYTGTSTNSTPTNQVYSQSFSATALGWNTIELTTPYVIDGNQDMWIFIHNTEVFDNLQVYLCSAEGSDGVYYSTNPTSYVYNNASGFAFLIQAYVSDGTYTYNLYRNNTKIAENLSNTSYTTALTPNTVNSFTIKTNYYGNESPASNMAGLAVGTASINGDLALGSNDHMTVTENSKLTVTGTVSNNNAANLVIENGAQLIHNTANVQATVKKSISAYTGIDNNWYFIASPVTENITPSTENGLLTNDYDLFIFDQSEELEWRNIKTGSFSTISHKIGYLYANSDNSTLTFAGTLVNNATSTPLVFDANAGFAGFNLIGNPYPCNTTIDRDFYVIENNAVTLASPGRVIAPCEGVFVKATSNNETVSFTKATSTKDGSSANCFDIVVSEGKANVDRARVRLNEGIGLEKFTLDDKHSQIFIQQNGHGFAVAYNNEENEMPLFFKAKKNGTYTLTIEAENLDLNYLHLIDHLTGADIDLLTTPSYSFEAKTTDYPSRFQLMFSEKENGNVIDDLDITEGELQILDMTGRVVGNDLNMKLTPGVYVLRVINGNDIKTKKIIIQ